MKHFVITTLGNKKIEEIEVGDKVWAYDEETGEKSLKQVVELFRNKTKKWIHLLFEFEDGTTEKLVCTEGHPFYVNNIGWVNSGDLLENDMVLMYNNSVATLIQKEIEELETYATTYNFEVEDYHTYYVGENSLLVHNDCRTTQRRKYWKKEANELKGKDINYKATTKNINRMKRGLAPTGLDGKSVELHHVKGILNDFDDIVQIQRSNHILYHKSYGYSNFTKLITEAADFVGKFI